LFEFITQLKLLPGGCCPDQLPEEPGTLFQPLLTQKHLIPNKKVANAYGIAPIAKPPFENIGLPLRISSVNLKTGNLPFTFVTIQVSISMVPRFTFQLPVRHGRGPIIPSAPLNTLRAAFF